MSNQVPALLTARGTKTFELHEVLFSAVVSRNRQPKHTLQDWSKKQISMLIPGSYLMNRVRSSLYTIVAL